MLLATVLLPTAQLFGALPLAIPPPAVPPVLLLRSLTGPAAGLYTVPQPGLHRGKVLDEIPRPIEHPVPALAAAFADVLARLGDPLRHVVDVPPDLVLEQPRELRVPAGQHALRVTDLLLQLLVTNDRRRGAQLSRRLRLFVAGGLAHPVELRLKARHLVGQAVLALHDPFDEVGAFLRRQFDAALTVLAFPAGQFGYLFLDPALHPGHPVGALLQLLHVPAELLALVAVQQPSGLAQLVESRDPFRAGR